MIKRKIRVEIDLDVTTYKDYDNVSIDQIIDDIDFQTETFSDNVDVDNISVHGYRELFKKNA